MYERRPSAEELAVLGLSEEDWASSKQLLIFRDNLESVRVFESMATQWRTGMGGPVGLDYGALEVIMRLHSVPKERAGQVFSDVQYMEALALQCMRE